jgi:Fur family ferric uptake transcriptional regulator
MSMGRSEHPPELAPALRARGLRVTAQREQVLDAVHHLAHATPEQISDALPDVDLTTVYRTLELLEEIGLVKHAHLGHGAPVYRPAGDDHVHVVCHSCGSVADAPPDLVRALADRLRRERGFEVDRSHFTVFGQCADCVARDQASGDHDAHEHAADEPAAHGAPAHAAPAHGASAHGKQAHGTQPHGTQPHGTTWPARTLNH